jgi:hypothetical protein
MSGRNDKLILEEIAMTNEQHNKYLGISFLVYGGINLLWAIAFFLIFSLVFTGEFSNRGGGPPLAFISAIFGFVFLFQLMFTLPSFVAGYALLKRKHWARIAGIVGAATSAMSVPLGTAVCIYALWFFLSDKGKEFYADKQYFSNKQVDELPSGSNLYSWDAQKVKEKDYVRPSFDPPDWRG